MKKNERHVELNGMATSGVMRMRSFEGASFLLYTYVSSFFQFKGSVKSYGKHKWSL
jgi:hypothetical protein